MAVLHYFGWSVLHVEIHIVCKSGVVYIQLGTISKQCLLDFSHHVAKSLLEMYPFKTEAHPRRMRLWCGSYRPLSLKREKTPSNKQQEGSSYTNQFSPEHLLRGWDAWSGGTAGRKQQSRQGDSNLIPNSTFRKVLCPGVVGIGVCTGSGSARHSSSNDLGSVDFNSSLSLCQFPWDAREGKGERAGSDHVLLVPGAKPNFTWTQGLPITEAVITGLSCNRWLTSRTGRMSA